MIYLVLGGASSGKSNYAEQLALRLAADGKPTEAPRVYLATMRVYDEESRRRVVRHRAMRAGRGFHTIEQPEDIDAAAAQIAARCRGEDIPSPVVLLECLPNLLANEIFPEVYLAEADWEARGAAAVPHILEGIREIAAVSGHLIIVSDEIFEDGVEYEGGTAAYVNGLAALHREIARSADAVTEVVCGIPILVQM